MSKRIREYDENNNLIYYKDSSGYEEWYKFDKNNNRIYYKNSSGELWWKYDENNNLVYSKRSFGGEMWYKYCYKNKQRISITKQEFNEIEFRKKEKEYLSRKKCSRFEIMEI